MKIKIGIGIDVHRLEEGREFWIGGIKIPFEKGCIAHSDGDVLIHAICDAILGAAGMRDIGFHFPDTSNAYKDIDSKILLKQVVDMIERKGFSISNVDSVICLERPKLKLLINDMRECLAEIMGLSMDDVSVKATTTEQMGFEGRGEGVSAHATVLLYKL